MLIGVEVVTSLSLRLSVFLFIFYTLHTQNRRKNYSEMTLSCNDFILPNIKVNYCQ